MVVTIDFSPKGNAGWSLIPGKEKYKVQVSARKEGTNHRLSKPKYFTSHKSAVIYARKLAKQKKAKEIFNHFTYKKLPLKVATKKRRSRRVSQIGSFSDLMRGW